MTNVLPGINSRESNNVASSRISNLPYGGEIYANLGQQHGAINYTISTTPEASFESFNSTLNTLEPIFNQNVTYDNGINGENAEGSLRGVKKAYTKLCAYKLTNTLPNEQEIKIAKEFAEQYDFQQKNYNTMNTKGGMYITGPGIEYKFAA